MATDRARRNAHRLIDNNQVATRTAVVRYRASRMRRPALAVVIILVASASAASAAHAAIAWTPCSTPGLQCAKLPVPLDPTGAVPGTVTLSLERVVGVANPANTAIIALAGGPGQAALPLTDDIAQTLKPGLTAQDMVIFDQRGTGASGALNCHALSLVGSADSLTALSSLTARCANELGPTRAFYTTAQSVADIEALRVAAGYSKLILFGVSYGTKVAEEYAATYPQNVAGLILDSVVTPTGPDPLNLTTFAAIARVLRELCAHGACNSATPNVNADLAAILKRTGAHPISGTAVDGRGRRVLLTVTSQDLFGVLVQGDLDPALRAELPAALHGAHRGDTAPLLRLIAHAEGLNAIAGAQASSDEAEDDALFLDTTCEESILPWPRTVTNPTQRRAAARAAIAGLPASAFAPFTRTDALDSQSVTLCLGWPQAAPAPATLGPLPAVHTLIIEGQADLRTTVADAQSVAAQIPGSSLLVVPHSGHSVLGTDLSGCAEKAVKAFFANQPPAQCSRTTPNVFSPVSVAPMTLARVKGATRVLKTALAARLTIVDEVREFIGDAIEVGHPAGAGSRVGGLRGGYSRLTTSTIDLVGVSYVPGVTVTGAILLRTGAGTVHVSGSSAAQGTIHFSASGAITGTLGGHHIHAHLAASAARSDSATAAAFGALRRPLPVPLAR